MTVNSVSREISPSSLSQRPSPPGYDLCSEKSGHLGRYTHRVAISNHRLISLADGQVTFLWRDSAHNNEQKPMTLPLDKFLRRFLLHILPQGFVPIRHFGFLANRRRATLLPLCFHHLGSAPAPRAQQHVASNEDTFGLWRCPKCGAPMKVVERLTAAERAKIPTSEFGSSWQRASD
jgi:hypothetical protein